MTSKGVWCKNDFSAVSSAPASGQLHPGTQAGKYIIDLMRTVSPTDTILDIGTWTGNGSTLCFLIGLKDMSYNQFISVECNEDKNQIAIQNLTPYLTTGKDHILWGSILTPEEASLEHTLDVFPSLKDNADFRRWHTVDLGNIALCPNIMDRLPDSLDVVLFDGGEFTTYFEFFKLLPRCKKYIMMDDCHVDKCRLMREYLKSQSNWTEVLYLTERNGFCVFKRKE